MVHAAGGLLYDDGEVEADPRRVKGAPIVWWSVASTERVRLGKRISPGK